MQEAVEFHPSIPGQCVSGRTHSTCSALENAAESAAKPYVSGQCTQEV